MARIHNFQLHVVTISLYRNHGSCRLVARGHYRPGVRSAVLPCPITIARGTWYTCTTADKVRGPLGSVSCHIPHSGRRQSGIFVSRTWSYCQRGRTLFTAIFLTLLFSPPTRLSTTRVSGSVTF